MGTHTAIDRLSTPTFAIARRKSSRIGVLALLAALIGGGAASIFGAAGPAAAARPSADLSVTLTSAGTAQAGKPISYVVKVTNHGPSTADEVGINFTTAQKLSSVHYRLYSRGQCNTGSKQTTCLVYSIGSGHTATATITGTLSKKLKKGAALSSKVTLTASTHLVKTTNDTAAYSAKVGIPTAVASAAPNPSPSKETKLDQINNAASSAVNATNTVAIASFVALGAAALWFAIGLSYRAYRRHQKPDSFLDA